MSKHVRLSMIMAAATLGVTGSLAAQGRSVVSRTELDAAAAARTTRNTQVVGELLGSDQARKLAGKMGISPAELSARVAGLDQASLNQLAQRAQVDVLAGGSRSIVVSTTAIIIALLVLILLVG